MTGRDDFGLGEVIRQLARRGAGGVEWFKDSCLLRRIEVRMRARAVPTLIRYAALLSADDAEADCLLHTLSVRVTGFFRNPDTWLRLWTLLGQQPSAGGAGLSAWCMGCATGEEAWSLAMLLRDLGRPATAPTILGSDVDAQAIETARRGRYALAAAEAVREVLPASQGAIHDGEYEVDPGLRPLVSFTREDLTQAVPAAAAFDLVLCRNLLIFLGKEGQRRVLDAAVQGLRPDGLLVLGRTESLLALPEAPFERVDAGHRIYRRTS